LIQRDIARWAKMVEKYLDEQIPVSSTLHQSMKYSLLSPGKRLRPALILATGTMFGQQEQDLLPFAAAVECIHAYSLIHDDLPCMDNDDLRRGQPTNHRVFGQAIALLAGDALQTLAFELMTRKTSVSDSIQINVIRTLAEASGMQGMVLGQTADMQAEQNREASLEALEFIHLHKTGKLLQACVVIGGLSAEVSPSDHSHLKAFGGHLGMAFQIVDDILDVTGDTALLGKTVGADVAHGKLTYPSLLGLSETRTRLQDIQEMANQELSALSVDGEVLRQMLSMVVNRDR
jgi:geranylgeranyl diphosphate synthase type II